MKRGSSLLGTLRTLVTAQGREPTSALAAEHADRVSKPLRAKVEAAIAELGYSPNPQAQSLRTGRTNLVAVLIPDILNRFYPELVKVIQTGLETNGLDTLVFNTDVPECGPARSRSTDCRATTVVRTARTDQSCAE